MIALYTTLPRIRFLLFFIRALFAEVCHTNLQSVVWSRRVCARRRDLNMAAVNAAKNICH